MGRHKDRNLSAVLTIKFLEKFSTWFDFPRGGAKPHAKQGWSRLQKYRSLPSGGSVSIHRHIMRKELIEKLQRGEPVAAAFLRLEVDEDEWTYQFFPQIKFWAVDFDLKINDIPAERLEEIRTKMHDAVDYVYKWMDLRGLSPGLSDSGSKGNHIYSKFDRDIDLGYQVGFFDDLTKVVPHFEQKGGKCYLYGPDGTVWAEIDSLFKTGQGGLIKLPFSQHQDKPGFWELPIDIKDLRTYRPIENPTDEDFQRAVDVFNTWKIVPAEHVEKMFHNYSEFNRRGRPKKRKQAPTGKIEIPELTPKLETELAKIDAWLDKKTHHLLPCFAYAHHKSVTKEIPYDLRGVIARLIYSRCGRNDAARQLAMLYIYYRINDEDDKLHTDRLEYQVNYWIDNFPHIVESCKNLQMVDAPFFCCESPCGRSCPQDRLPLPDFLKIPPVDRRPLPVILDDSKEKEENIQLFKAPRVGATTEVVVHALKWILFLILVTPTTKIVETMQKAFKIFAEQNPDEVRYGAILRSNADACLLLKKLREHNRQIFARQPLALDGLPYLIKPLSCKDCPYVNAFLPLVPNEVWTDSDLDNDLCLFTSIVHHLDILNVLQVTDKKVYSILAAVRAVMNNPFIKNKEDVAIVKIHDAIQYADLIALDELSMYVDTPSATLTVRIRDDSGKIKHDLVLKVRGDMQLLTTLARGTPDAAIKAAEEIAGGILVEINELVKAGETMIAIARPHYADTEITLEPLKKIQQFAAVSNIALVDLFKTILLAPEQRWLYLNEPDPDNAEHLAVYIEPKFRDHLALFFSGSLARIIALDATMPLVAAIHLDEIMKVPFSRVNIGDPRDTKALMRLIPYPVDISFSQLLDVQGWQDELQALIEGAIHRWGIEFLIAAPSKKIAVLIKGMFPNDALEVIWHRGSETVGVECDKRIMIGVCSPFAPGDALHWKKELVFPELLADVPASTQHEYDMQKTLYQTMSRVKDPRLDSMIERRSVYIGFGQTEDKLEAMRLNMVEPPELLSPPPKNQSRRYRVDAVLQTASDWLGSWTDS